MVLGMESKTVAALLTIAAVVLLSVTSAGCGGDATQSSMTADSAMEVMARGDLGDAAQAQKDFFTDNDFYTTELNDLEGYGFEPNTDVTIVIYSADASSYCIEGAHDRGGDFWSFSNDSGFLLGNNC